MPLSAVMRIRKLFHKVHNYLDENKRLNDESAKEMDKKYPAGWSQNAYHMSEMNQIRKRLKNK